MAKKPSAFAKRKRFILAIRHEHFGVCPKPPKHCAALRVGITNFVGTHADSVIVSELHTWNKAEIRYVLKVVKRLGYVATWE